MALTPKQERMNHALDELLTDAAVARLSDDLALEPEAAAEFERLREASALLHQPPLVAAPEGFAIRVMARIEAGEHEVYAAQRRTALWVGVSVAAAAALLVPLGVLLLSLGASVIDLSVVTAFFQSVVGIVGAVSGALQQVLLFLGGLISAYPMLPALTLTVIPLVMVWAWLVWYLQQHNRPATVVIKVQTVR